MKANRKQRPKRNIFSDDDSDESENQTEKGNASEVKQEKNDIYDPAKMKQNEMYINKKQVDHTIFAFDVNGEQNSQDEKPIEKSKKQRKKKNLFEDSQEEQSNQEGENTHLQLQKTNTPLKQKKKQKSESNSQTQSEESPQRTEKVEGVINQEKEKEKQINQQSFQILINEKGKSLEERKKLFSKPLEKGYQAICYFKRIVSGFSQTYELLGEDERPLIFCQNQRGSIGANYYFSLTKEMDKTSSSYLGKLRGNASGSQYQLYNDGKQPGKHLDRSQWRTSLAYIEYESNFMGMNGPRKFKVSLPNFGEYDEDSYKLAENENLTAFQPPIIKNYRNKQPRWNERLKSYALNFGGRVKQASIKNFIMIDDEISTDLEISAKNAVVFGKIDENTFSLEFIHPLSAVQAFGIAISEFDFKLKCE